MKVRISFTVDIDQKAWADGYGVSQAAVRGHVQAWAKDAVYGAIRYARPRRNEPLTPDPTTDQEQP